MVVITIPGIEVISVGRIVVLLVPTSAERHITSSHESTSIVTEICVDQSRLILRVGQECIIL